MTKQKIWRIISIIIAVFSLIYGIHSMIEYNKIKEGYISLYEKGHLTNEDIKTLSSDYKYCTTTMPNEESATSPEAITYKKLYGIEYIGQYEVDKDGGINVKFLHGDPAKILILDEKGNERFYAEVSELDFEPGEAGEYDVYLVGNKFTGRVAFSTYKCE